MIQTLFLLSGKAGDGCREGMVSENTETVGLQRWGGVTWEIWARTVWAPKEETAGVGCSVHSVLLRGFPC